MYKINVKGSTESGSIICIDELDVISGSIRELRFRQLNFVKEPLIVWVGVPGGYVEAKLEGYEHEKFGRYQILAV